MLLGSGQCNGQQNAENQNLNRPVRCIILLPNSVGTQKFEKTLDSQ